MPIFDIPTDRLSDLTDAELRELVARLCEAERERQGGHRNEVRWGGSQTAPDGGLDVVVEVAEPFVAAGSLARSNIGIQVKKADYPPASITAEMRYGGTLRPAISLLAEKGGAYIIASIDANCSEMMLQRRIKAMRDAVADDPHKLALDLNFLDRKAISRWVSAHPSVAVWLRICLGLPTLSGWQPYGRWSSTPAGDADDLICEKGLVFHLEGQEPIRSLPNALDEIRKLILGGKGSVRIAGLSGIGKSRIVQALFEPVGNVTAFAISHAIYTDLGHSPTPSPMEMLEALIARNSPAILVVDNCPPETHRALARKLAQQLGPVRIISVEYDVRTDRPEETDVIRIEAESPEVVEALLRRRYDHLSSSDAHRLAELAQGNARLAFALAQSTPHAGTLSAFDDSALFDRLFWQREERNDELARAAEVLSLVYSFEVEGEEEPDELTFLGSLAELSRGAMHRYAATLLDRGLAQARSRWRAVLPHALANRLARQALKSIHWRIIADEFAGKLRLRRSLARRLSYLHDSEEARHIVNRWTEAGGPLNGPTADVQILEATCHLAPVNALQLVDDMTVVGADSYQLDSLIRITSRTAYSEDIFPRACATLLNIAITFEQKQASNANDALSHLFGLYLSGTLAQTETRIQVVRRYLFAKDLNQNECGIKMLNAALTTGGWSSSILFLDDARPSSFGWEPEGKEILEWFTSWIDLAVEAALSVEIPETSNNIKKILANKIDGIWKRVPSLRTRIEEITRELHATGLWAEGQHALKQMLYLIRRSDTKFPEDDIERVSQLINDIEPIDLEARMRAELVRGWDFDFEDYEDISAAENRREQRLEQIGKELAVAKDTLRAVGRDVLEAKSGFFYSLGAGLALGANEPISAWHILKDLHLIAPSKTRKTCVLSGFIQEIDKFNPALAASIRAECREIPALRQEYGIFLSRGALPAQELDHIIQIAGEPETPVWQFNDIIWRKERELNDKDRIRLLRIFFAKPDGLNQVIEALEMLHHVERNDRDSWPEDLQRVGLEAIMKIIASENLDPIDDGRIARALEACLRGDDGSNASHMMEVIIGRSARRYGSTYDVERLLVTLAKNSPGIFLRHTFPDDSNELGLKALDSLRTNPLSHVPISFLVEWCKECPARWTKVAPEISPFTSEIDYDAETAASPISAFAAAFLNAAPHPEEVVEAYLQNLDPMSWSGSRANIIEHRLTNIESLDHPAPEVMRTISRLAPDIRSRINRIRQSEQNEERIRDERFE